MLRKQEADAKEAEIKGVAVSWHPAIVPTGPDAQGNAEWRYDIEVHNPGSLPIRDVNVWLTFPAEFRRVHSGGSRDPSTTVLDVGTAVIFSRGQRTWRRTLQMPYSMRHDLRTIRAKLTFVDGHDRPRHWESGALAQRENDDGDPN
jgi:hypothetical protein